MHGTMKVIKMQNAKSRALLDCCSRLPGVPIPSHGDSRPSVIDKNRPIKSIKSITRDEKYEARDSCQII